MRVLVLCNDFYHPAATVRAGLAPLAGPGRSFDVIEDAADWSATSMQQADVVILTRMNERTPTDRQPWMDAAAEAAFLAYVQAGKGLLVIHSGLAGYQHCPTLRRLVGGAFVHHPPMCDVTVEPAAGHPLADGAAAFTCHDEHYFVELDAGLDVFLTARSAHGVQPAGWRRSEGAGRVCALTPAHELHGWREPAYQSIIANALSWVAPDGVEAEG